ncbi:13012_t:CDS:2 [Ambispora gerdemannii]|uniref:13012_t:CDS:1 n=1 Tax=Ambispora gerdemannii TaxID=144530 RepID=A0A9N9G8B8_9GLOM|nr:13012_t:CDS:2 [Ambispora gerdemannii]
MKEKIRTQLCKLIVRTANLEKLVISSNYSLPEFMTLPLEFMALPNASVALANLKEVTLQAKISICNDYNYPMNVSELILGGNSIHWLPSKSRIQCNFKLLENITTKTSAATIFDFSGINHEVVIPLIKISGVSKFLLSKIATMHYSVALQITPQIFYVWKSILTLQRFRHSIIPSSDYETSKLTAALNTTNTT